VAVDPETKVITGHYGSGTGRSADGSGPQFTCIFFFRGEAKGAPPYRIRSWYDADKTDADVIDGEVAPLDEGGVSIHLKQEHGGCWNVQHFADKEPAYFEYDAKDGGWRGVRVVAAKKAYFHDTPDAAARRKAYVVEGDALRVYETQPGWVQVRYTTYGKRNEEIETEGWIKAGDLYPDTVPRAARK